MDEHDVRSLREQFEDGYDPAPDEIAALFAYIEELESCRTREPLDWQRHLELGGWIRSLPGSRYPKRR